MSHVRILWSILTLATGMLGVVTLYFASQSKSAFTTCEIEPEYDPTCGDSLIGSVGTVYVVGLFLPTALCAVPALFPRRTVAWATVGVLIVSATVVFTLAGGVGAFLAATAVPALLLAAGHDRLTRKEHAASMPGSSLHQLLQHQKS